MKRLLWNELDAAARRASLRRPAQADSTERSAIVARLIAQVRADGDATLRALTRRYDGCELGDLDVGAEEFAAAETRVAPALREAIAQARERIARVPRAPPRRRRRASKPRPAWSANAC